MDAETAKNGQFEQVLDGNVANQTRKTIGKVTSKNPGLKPGENGPPGPGFGDVENPNSDLEPKSKVEGQFKPNPGSSYDPNHPQPTGQITYPGCDYPDDHDEFMNKISGYSKARKGTKGRGFGNDPLSRSASPRIRASARSSSSRRLSGPAGPAKIGRAHV